MSASFAPASAQSSQRPGRPHPGFIATTARILAILILTTVTLVGGVLYQARTSCPDPCWIDGLTPHEALRGSPRSMPPR